MVAGRGAGRFLGAGRQGTAVVGGGEAAVVRGGEAAVGGGDAAVRGGGAAVRENVVRAPEAAVASRTRSRRTIGQGGRVGGMS